MRKYYALIQLGCLNCNVSSKIIAIFSHYIHAYKVYNLCHKENQNHYFKIMKVKDISCNIPGLSCCIQNCQTIIEIT